MSTPPLLVSRVTTIKRESLPPFSLPLFLLIELHTTLVKKIDSFPPPASLLLPLYFSRPPQVGFLLFLPNSEGERGGKKLSYVITAESLFSVFWFSPPSLLLLLFVCLQMAPPFPLFAPKSPGALFPHFLFHKSCSKGVEVFLPLQGRDAKSGLFCGWGGAKKTHKRTGWRTGKKSICIFAKKKKKKKRRGKNSGLAFATNFYPPVAVVDQTAEYRIFF